MNFPFIKMHGAANDFVVVDHRKPFLPSDPGPLVTRLCDRRRGVGADGVLLLEADGELDFAMRYLNADGGVAEFCGNGARCLARFALELGLGRAGVVRFRSDAGVQEGRLAADGRSIELHFGRVEPGRPVALDAGGRPWAGRAVTAGVPHFVAEVADVAAIAIAESAPPIRRHPWFGAAGTNVDFVERLGPAHWAMRTWERGVEGETLACGSGAIATAVNGACAGDASPVRVRTAGGDTLEVALTREGEGWDVRLIGPAEVAFRGEWTEPAPAARG